jgi:uncharacterized phage infection (PIP) family protein YhgE
MIEVAAKRVSWSLLIPIRTDATAVLELIDYSGLLDEPPAGIRDDLRQAIRSATDAKPKVSAVRTMLDKTGIEKKNPIEEAAKWILGKR